MNTANLQLEGLTMAIASISQALVEKGLLTHEELAASLVRAEEASRTEHGRELSDANRAAILFPIRVLLLANEAGARGERFSFSACAERVGRST